MTDDEEAEIAEDFCTASSMPPVRLERWLETGDSTRICWNGDDGGALGGSIGLCIVEINKADLTTEVNALIVKAIDQVARYIAKVPF